MPIVLNTNSAATEATFNLSKANDNLRRSIARLSSGNRITKPTDDAGGLAVAYKLNSSVKRTEAALNNHQNALSFLQVQDGVLEAIGDIVDRMSELRTMAADVSKNAADVENYSKEFLELQDQLAQMKREKFNGVELFSVEEEWSLLNSEKCVCCFKRFSRWKCAFSDDSLAMPGTFVVAEPARCEICWGHFECI